MKTRTLSDINRRNGKPAWLREDAAGAYERMKRAGMPAGCVSDAGRTYAEQAEMYRRYLAGELPATAARPGTSKHETGIALDVAEPARKWVRKFGKYYGWQKDRVRNEPWHMEHDPKRDRSKHVKVKRTGKLDAATYRAVSRAVARPRINKPSKASGKRAFWRHVQREINCIMRGAKKWDPLVVDGIDGPATWEGLRRSIRQTNRTGQRPGKKATHARVIRTWQRGLNQGRWGRSIEQING